jgi:hypothetical protein
MRHFVVLLSLSLMFGSMVLADELHGTWHATVKGDRIHLDIVRDRGNWGRSMPRSTFASLSDAQINAATETPVRFELSREAGTIAFSGTFEAGEGVGRFTFTPNPAYATTLQSLGVASSELTDERLFSLASLDVSTAFIHDMQALGYRETLDQYVAFRIHGATPEFVRDLKSLGYDDVSAEQLVAFRIHGVTPEFIRDLKAAGYSDISGDQLVTFRIHGVTPEFVRDLKSLGYTVSAEQLVAFRIHGVTPEYVRNMRDLGVKGLSDEDVVAMRIHGVSVDYVRELRDLGYSGLSSDQLVTMRIHGVSTRFIRELADAGYHGIPVEKLVEMRIHGIDAEFVKKVK